MDFAEIQKRLEKIRADAVQYLADMETEGLTDARKEELDQSYEKAMAEFDELRAKADKHLKLRGIDEAIMRYVEPEASKPPLPDVKPGDPEADGEMSYEDAFRAWIRSNETRNRMTPEVRAALAKGYVSAEERAQSTGTATEGGYLIPEGFMAEVVRTMKYWGPMADGDIVREVMTDSGNDIPWPTVDDTSKTGATTAENAAVSEDAIAFNVITLKAYNYDSGMILVPWQLLEDEGVNLVSLIGELIGERLARGINAALTTGAGSSGPQGIMVGASNGVTGVSKTAGLTVANIYSLHDAVDPAYRRAPSCGWMMNDAIMGAVRKITYGGNSDARPLWQMGDIKTMTPDVILNKPVYLNQDINSGNIGGATKDVALFGDLRKYVVRKVRGVHMVTLRERYAEKRQNAYFAWCRVDGRVLDSDALKVAVTAA